MLGPGAMVTYLHLCFHSVKQLIELVDVVVVPLAERLHDLARVLVGIGGSEPPRTTPSANQGIISRSFSLVSWSGWFLVRTLLRQPVRQLGTIARSDNPQVGGLEGPVHRHDGSAWSSCWGKSYSPPPAKSSPHGYLMPGGGGLAAENQQTLAVSAK